MPELGSFAARLPPIQAVTSRTLAVRARIPLESAAPAPWNAHGPDNTRFDAGVNIPINSCYIEVARSN